LRRTLGVAILALLLSPALSIAQTSSETLLHRIGLSGSLRGSYWSSSRELDDRQHFFGSALWLKAAPRLGERLSILAEGWVRNEELLHEDATRGQLREAYLETGWGPLDLRIGKQIVAWGRADRINPTDNLTAKNFTLLDPDDDDQRLGTPAVKARCQGSMGSYDQVTSSLRASGIRSQPVASQAHAVSGPHVTSTDRCST